MIVFLDARSMFTTIPVNLKGLHPEIVSKFFSLCLKYNKNKKYEFLNGLPMGGPLSMLTLEVFTMNQLLEMNVINGFAKNYSICFWARYVDVFFVWNNDSEADL